MYNPNAIEDLIWWLEGSHHQEIVIHQLAEQVGDLNPGQYMFPYKTYPTNFSLLMSQTNASLVHLTRLIVAHIHLSKNFGSSLHFRQSLLHYFMSFHYRPPYLVFSQSSYELWLYPQCPQMLAKVGVVILY